MSRITINPSFYVATDSDEAAIGHDWALEAVASIAEGKPKADAVKNFVEAMMEFVIAEPRAVAPALYGAISLFLDVSRVKVETKNVFKVSPGM
jgi:hypothetical protein